jgi:uncharacterized protein (TIGR02118 family)
MIKVVLLVRRKPGISREEFRRYYEGRHAPLAASQLRSCVRYVRNFVVEDLSGEPDFDCVTEFWYELDGPWRAARDHIASEASRQALAEDEARFMDRASMRVVVVAECETPPASLARAPSCGGPASADMH